MIPPYTEFITRLGLFSKKWDYTPPAVPHASPLGDYTPCRAIFPFFWFNFFETCTYGVYNPSRAIFLSIFFRELFFSWDHTPHPQPSPHNFPVGRFFLNFFFSKIFFSPQKQAHGWLFWSTGAREKIIIDFFFGSDLWRTHFGPIFGPILDTLDPFWTILDHFGHFGWL